MVHKLKSFKQFIIEGQGQDLIIVDVQKAYAKNINFDLYEFAKFITTEPFRKKLYLYNGPELGFGDYGIEVINWISEHIDYDEEIMEPISRMKFVDKGYGFFRNLMDAGLDLEEIVKLIRYMYQNNITDSRDIEDETYEELGIDNPGEDGIWIPEILEYLEDYDNIVLCGGGKTECLLEVELCLKALNKSYKRIDKFTY